MAFLRLRDYFTEIRETDLDDILLQISQSTAHTPDTVRQENELNTQEIVETMIAHRYDVRKIFTDILTFNLTDTFQINDLVEYSETAYDRTLTYVADDRVSFKQEISKVLNDDIYNATGAVATNENPLTNPTKWTKITENFSLYHADKIVTAVLPDVAFSFSINNFTGNHDTILGWDKTRTIFFKRRDTRIEMYYSTADRTAQTNKIGVVDFDPSTARNINQGVHHHVQGHDHGHGLHNQHHAGLDEFDKAIKQFPTNIPIQFGDDREDSLSGDLSIIGFTPDLQEWNVVATNAFIKGDNRSRLMKKILVNLAIFELHKLINPRNIPDLRGEAKDDAMDLLKKISNGKITADLPIFFDKQKGQNTTFSSNRKLHHGY